MKPVLRSFILFIFIVTPFLVHGQVASFMVSPRGGCGTASGGGLSVTLTDNSTPTATVYHKFIIYWDSTWVSGSVTDTLAIRKFTSAITNSTTATYTQSLIYPGFYNVIDSAYTSSGSNTSTKHNYLFVDTAAALNVRITTSSPATDTNTCVGHSVTFLNRSDTIPGVISTFTWNIISPSSTDTSYTTSGYTSTLTHTLSAPGTYNIVLTETTSTCNGSILVPFTIKVDSFPTACFTNTDSVACESPATVSFSNCSSGASSYLWRFGDGDSSTVANPSHTYHKTGSITDTLIAYSAFGCATTKRETGNIIIGNFIPGFKVSSSTVCQKNTVDPGSITFTDTTSGATSYSWHDNYSPAHTSTAANPSFTYSTAGTYTVTDSVYNGTCFGTITHTVTVNAAPVVSFTGTHLYKCTLPDTVQFASTVAGGLTPYTYEWHFGDGLNAADSSNSSTPQHIYTTARSFTDSLVVTDANGCASLKSITGYVNTNLTTLTISPVSSDSGCAPFNFSYTTSINPSLTPAIAHIIDSVHYGDGSVTIPGSGSGSHSYALNGIDTMMIYYHLPDSLGGCIGTPAINYIKTGSTLPAFGPPGHPTITDTVCPNSTVALTCNCTNCTSFRWNFNSPSYPASSNIFGCDTSHLVTTPGFHYLQAIANDAGCTDTTYDTVYVLPPLANLQYKVNCENRHVVAFSTTGDSAVTHYSWNFGDATTDTGASPTHTYTAYGTYTVILTDSALHSCFNKDSIVVRSFPRVDSFHAASTSACTGKSIVFTGSLTAYGSTDSAYTWIWGDGTTPVTHYGSDTASHAYTHSGFYTDTLVIKSNGCYDTAVSVANYITIGGLAGSLTYTTSGSCAPTELTLKDNNTDFTGAVINRHWNFNAAPSVTGAGTPPATLVHGAAADTTVYYPQGAYTIFVTDTDNIGCSITDTIHVALKKPNAYFYSVDSNVKACVGATIPFVDTNTNCTYAWSFGDGGTSAIQDPTHDYTSNGVYSVSVVVTTTTGGTLPVGCKDTFSRPAYITVDTIDIGFSLLYSTPKCPGFYELATNTTSPLSEYTYQWRLTPYGTLVSSIGDNFYHELSSPSTNYAITLYATNALGCKDSLTKYESTTGAAGYIYYSTADSGCAPLSVTMHFVDTNSTTPSGYVWSKGDGTTSSVDSDHVTFTYASDSVSYHPYITLLSGTGCPTVQIPNGDAFAYTDSITAFVTPTVTVTDTLLCYGASDTLKATGAGDGGTYVWSPAYGLSATTGAAVVANPTVTTTYTITGTTVHGCSNTVTAKITVDTMITINITGKDSVCSGICDTLKATGGTHYTWSPGSGLSATTGSSVTACTTTSRYYEAVYTDLHGCKGTDSFRVTVNPLPSVIGAIPSYTVCVANTSQLTDSAIGGLWSINDTLIATISNTGVVTGVSPGTATVTYTTGTGCTETHLITIKSAPGVIEGINNLCVGSQTILFDTISGGTWTISPATGIASITGSGSSVNVQGITAGPATVSYTISDGCSVLFPISINPLPDISYSPNPPHICYGTGDSVQIFANSDAATYLWRPNVLISADTVYNPTFYDTVNSHYELTETTSFGCKDSTSLIITVYDSTTIVVSSDTSVCIGQSMQLAAYVSSSTLGQDNISYLWSPSATLNNPNISNPVATPDSTTTYTVTIGENQCFTGARNVTVTVIPVPQIVLPASSTIIAGSSVTLTATIANGDSIANWSWTPNYFLSCDTCSSPIATPTATTTYQVKATTPIGCVDSNDVQISLVCVEAGQVFVPNTFTPNGDGSNDRFYLSGRGLGLITRMSVYNRWGELVFEAKNINSNDPGAGWDGTYKGQVLQPDVFVYVFDMLCETGVPFTLTGDISIVR